MPQINLKFQLPRSGSGGLRSFDRFRAAFFLGLFVLAALPAFADETWNKSYQTRYTEILYAHDEELHRFTADIGTGLSFWSASSKKNPLLVKSRVDSVTDAVIRILDMRPVELNFSIRIYPSQADLDIMYRRMGMMTAAPPAFYSHSSKSISVSLENISSRILAHEIAHAVICAYFGSPPPRRMQEILAQYVDEHLEE
jgi:hypothetical protein